MKIESFDRIFRDDGLLNEWRKTIEMTQSPSVFATPDFMKVWWSIFAKPRNDRIFCSGGKSGSGFGMVQMMKMNKRIGPFVGPSYVAMKNAHIPAFNPIFVETYWERYCEELCSCLMKTNERWATIQFEHLAISRAELKVLTECFRACGCQFGVTEYNGSFSLTIGQEGFDEYFRTLNKSFRKNRLNMNNRLDREGLFNFEHYEFPRQEEFERFLGCEHSGWKKEGRSSISSDRRLEEFYRQLVGNRNGDFVPSISILGGQNRDLAAILGLSVGRKFFFLKIGLKCPEEDLSKRTSPGQAVLYRLIEHCHLAGYKEFDFCGPYYEYEKRWNPEKKQKHNLIIVNSKARLVRRYLEGKNLITPI
jgi:hypothetical protein